MIDFLWLMFDILYAIWLMLIIGTVTLTISIAVLLLIFWLGLDYGTGMKGD